MLSCSWQAVVSSRISFFLSPYFFQLLHVAKFEYTNWTAADEGASRFAMVRKLAADLQVDCPVQEFIEAVERRADVFR